MYTKQDGLQLLKLARESIEREFNNKEPEKLDNEKFNEKRGVFVTLYENNQLRGCIGFPYPTLSLEEAIKHAAKSAAFSDPRFPELTEQELKDVKIEISVLSKPEKCKLKNIKKGDGVIIGKDNYSSLFLPQVWEQLPTKEEFLGNLCMKAGLDKDEWKKKINFSKFSVKIFSEK
tara:strand:+ start:437 stop:961 length:525 start_codon:yes stop_codon:yes gene_type:complete